MYQKSNNTSFLLFPCRADRTREREREAFPSFVSSKAPEKEKKAQEPKKNTQAPTTHGIESRCHE